MLNRDFCYWLQGYFELAKPEGFLTVEQVTCVAKHAAMVHESEKKVDEFVLFVEHVIEFCKSQGQTVHVGVFKAKLSVKFVHLDAETPGDGKKLDELHGSEGEVSRC